MSPADSSPGAKGTPTATAKERLDSERRSESVRAQNVGNVRYWARSETSPPTVMLEGLHSGWK
ncbi:MAG: hypothetical protein JWO19_3718 [Bryobacterales bacterium]|jgi:hypothetical protein|nr:hypothetical protein [Bryobacterales bacterium]